MATNCAAKGWLRTHACMPGCAAQLNSTIAGFIVSSVVTWTKSAETQKYARSVRHAARKVDCSGRCANSRSSGMKTAEYTIMFRRNQSRPMYGAPGLVAAPSPTGTCDPPSTAAMSVDRMPAMPSALFWRSETLMTPSTKAPTSTRCSSART